MLIGTICVFMTVFQYISGDINRRNVEYVLKSGVNATEDSFFFKITDKGKIVKMVF